MKSQMYSLFLLVIFASIGLAQRTALAQTNLWIERNTTAQSSTLSEKKAQPQPTAQMRPPIIDVHMHAFKKDERWNQRVPNPVNGQPMNATNEQAHMRATFAEMKKYNVVKAIASADYQAVLRWKAEAPDNIISSYSFFDPTTVDLEFLRKEHSAGRLSAIGEVAAQYQGLAPNDPKMEPIYALAEELDVPVGIHVGLSKPESRTTTHQSTAQDLAIRCFWKKCCCGIQSSVSMLCTPVGPCWIKWSRCCGHILRFMSMSR